MRLDAYLSRIGFSGRPRPDLASLQALMRAHLLAIPFEAVDVHLGAPLDLDPARIYDKIVERKRGGWCYEMNGLFGWALGELGFDVTRLAGGVMREQAGDGQIGNHLCLLVSCKEGPQLVDVGFGGSLFAPIPFAPGAHHHAPFDIGLAETGDGYWRFEEAAADGPFSFDVALAPADEALLAAKCAFLQTDPQSPFVQNLVVQKRGDERHFSLRGRVVTEISAAGKTKRLLADADELVGALKALFALDLPAAARLWPAIVRRHETLFGGES